MASSSMGSSSVTLDNVDDYLAPSQACVNPAFQPTNKLGEKKDGGNETGKESSSGNVIVPRRRKRIVRKKLTPMATQLDETTSESGAMSLVSKTVEEGQKKVVKASMADCLACSGCVTTAETVMMEERHSLKSLRKRLNSKGGGHRSRVVTLSPNSWADLCRHWNLAGDEPHHFYLSRFTTLLSNILSVTMVVDGNVPLQWSWIDEAKEFCEVYERNCKETTNGWETGNSDAPFPSMAIDSTNTLYYKEDGSSETKDNGDRPSPIMPLISGSCPALVCLVEKSLTKLVPHLSQAASPMSLVGMILKENEKLTSMDVSTDGENNENSAKKNSGWDHWAIMPCHDKKLEASRKDFALKSSGEQAVDLVISTKECVELVEEWIMGQIGQTSSDMTVAKYLASLSPSEVSTAILEPNELLQISSCTTTVAPLLVTTPVIVREESTDSSTRATQKQMTFSSGGHANYIFRYASKRLFGCLLENENGFVQVEWKAASLAMKNVRSARLGKLLKQHYYEAKLYRYQDGSFGTTEQPSANENDEKSSTVVLHFAIAHGMQTMQRALKLVDQTPSRNNAKNSTLHYLEAMACPHGCVNGGGSARLSSPLLTTGSDAKASSAATFIRETPTETRQRVRNTVGYLEVPTIDEGKTIATQLPRTEYHVVPPMNYTTGAVAGQKVENMIW